MDLAETIKRKLLANLDLNYKVSDHHLYEYIASMVDHEYLKETSSAKERLKLLDDIFYSIRGLGFIDPLLADEDVTEIMINGPSDIFVEKRGEISRVSNRFISAENLGDIVQAIVGRANKRVNEASPIVDTRLPDGSRVNIVLGPVAINGPIITIRKFPEHKITMKDLISFGSITEDAAEYLKVLVESGFNIFISGGTGSGKTTFLNALSEYIPSDERIITIEDSAELQIQNIPNLVSLECRSANSEGENEITIRDLIKTSLRMRPSRIVVGEVRGPEALDMLQAMNTGHDGSLSTGHANSPADMLSRLETLVLMGADMPLAAIRGQIASALDILVHLERVGKNRRVCEISEVCGISDGEIQLVPLFKADGDSALSRTGNTLSNTQKLRAGHEI